MIGVCPQLSKDSDFTAKQYNHNYNAHSVPTLPSIIPGRGLLFSAPQHLCEIEGGLLAKQYWLLEGVSLMQQRLQVSSQQKQKIKLDFQKDHM